MPDAASLPRLALQRCGARRLCLCGAAVWNGRTAGHSGAVREPIMSMTVQDEWVSDIKTRDPEGAILDQV